MEMNSGNQLCAEVCGRGDYFLQSGLLSDCKFLVGAEAHQEVISGHKLLLAMASPVFDTMFCGSMPENRDFIPIEDIDPETFKLLLLYIYKSSFNISSIDEAFNVFYAAKKYMMQHLVTKCIKYLDNHMNTENVLQIYTFAQLFDAPSLLTKCESIICLKTKDVLNTKVFENVDLDVANYVFSLDTLNIDSELDLIEAAARYAEALDESGAVTLILPSNIYNRVLAENNNSESQALDDKPLTNNRSESPNCSVKVNETGDNSPVHAANIPKATNKISNIRSLVGKIRFLTLPAHQSAAEETGVLFNTASRNANVPMPSDFTTYRTGRHHVTEVGSSGETMDSSPVHAANKSKATNKLSKIRTLVEKIRFLTLTPQQFVECSARKSIITSSEETDILFNLASRNANVPMPCGFTTYRAGRHRVTELGSSGSDATRAKATIRFEIQDYRNLSEVLESPPFYLRNVPWTIMIKMKTHLEIYVCCKLLPLNSSCKAEVQLCLISRISNIRRNFNHRFKQAVPTLGYAEFAPWTDIFDPRKGFLNDGAITVEAHIVAEEPQGVS